MISHASLRNGNLWQREDNSEEWERRKIELQAGGRWIELIY